MRIHSDGISDSAKACCIGWIGRKKGRLRHARIEIFDDGKRLRHHHAVDGQCRNEPLRVALAVLLGLMAAIQKIYRHAFKFDAL